MGKQRRLRRQRSGYMTPDAFFRARLERHVARKTAQLVAHVDAYIGVAR